MRGVEAVRTDSLDRKAATLATFASALTSLTARGVGVSMHVTRKRAVGIARHFDVGRGVAEVDLRGSTIAWARTGGRDHVTVWAPPELLLRAVVQCGEHE